MADLQKPTGLDAVETSRRNIEKARLARQNVAGARAEPNEPKGVHHCRECRWWDGQNDGDEERDEDDIAGWGGCLERTPAARVDLAQIHYCHSFRARNVVPDGMKTLDELAAEQGVRPCDDPSALRIEGGGPLPDEDEAPEGDCTAHGEWVCALITKFQQALRTGEFGPFLGWFETSAMTHGAKHERERAAAEPKTAAALLEAAEQVEEEARRAWQEAHNAKQKAWTKQVHKEAAAAAKEGTR